ncbi:MAG: hypothetical protein IJT25_01485 [Clostridia bacterium]|nr:hypothetical protein [Clostridia bacterium]
MVKFVIRIIAAVILLVGLLVEVFSKALVPEHKYKGAERERKAIKIKLIGFIICGVSIVIFLITAMF